MNKNIKCNFCNLCLLGAACIVVVIAAILWPQPSRRVSPPHIAANFYCRDVIAQIANDLSANRPDTANEVDRWVDFLLVVSKAEITVKNRWSQLAVSQMYNFDILPCRDSLSNFYMAMRELSGEGIAFQKISKGKIFKVYVINNTGEIFIYDAHMSDSRLGDIELHDAALVR